MVVALLFKEECAVESILSGDAPETRIIRFWIHQSNRLTDGHITIQPDGTSSTSINLSSKGKRSSIAARAAYDGEIRQSEAGFEAWDDARVADLLSDMQIESGAASPSNAFADAILAPVRAVESSMAEQLSIQWEVQDEDIPDAIGLRYHVVQKAEAILNDAGLLVDQMGTVVADDSVSATMEVTQFGAAKSLLMNTLSADERRYNCRIEHA